MVSREVAGLRGVDPPAYTRPAHQEIPVVETRRAGVEPIAAIAEGLEVGHASHPCGFRSPLHAGRVSHG